MSLTYLHLPHGREPPPIGALKPFKAVLILDQAVSDEWQHRISDWLVESGCLYMMAWGVNCASWDESVDWASLSAADFAEVPDDRFVMTTWHDDEPLSEALWFAQHAAFHPTVTLNNVVIVDVGEPDREGELRGAYSSAGSEPI